MAYKLIPRYSPGQAAARLEEIQEHLAGGKPAQELVRIDLAGAVPNATGGEAATHSDLRVWRTGVMDTLNGFKTGSKAENDIHGIELGKALSNVINPSPSDAASDGVWSFLSLVLFPDVVHARWPADSASHELSRDRWIGKQAGRDRNYLKLSWRRWLTLGPVMEAATAKLGEDEFGALLERSAVARNVRLLRIAAEEIVAFKDDGARTEFARALMKKVTYQTGPLNLDILPTEELAGLVRGCADSVLSLGSPRRAVARRPLGSEGDGGASPRSVSVAAEQHHRRRGSVSAALTDDARHEFTTLDEPDGKVRVACSCGFTVRRRKAGVERVEQLHRLHPTLTDSQLSQL